ncbi:MAG: type II toxin-antitoxin system RelE/ParE family toxin [Gammaproteobacteria bacterium]|nr:type II toxin-antitoxin system RelE/ParE family toxin [Gammaproteobacteria bacterium]
MAQVVYSERALTDFEDIFEFIASEDPYLAAETVSIIQEAVAILERHPLIGRAVEGSLRELVISRGRTGYLALYSYVDVEDVVQVLALRHQREAGYQD